MLYNLGGGDLQGVVLAVAVQTLNLLGHTIVL